MEDRSLVIAERIRRDLRRAKTPIEITDPAEIWDECNRVQTQIIQEMKTIENTLEVTLKKDVGEYDLLDNPSVTVTEIRTSWGGKLKVVKDNFEKYKNYVASDPLYIKISKGKIEITPKPNRDNDIIYLIVAQTDIINPMDEDIEPEIPQDYDEVLVAGVCAKYNSDEFLAKYYDLLNRTLGNTLADNIPSHVEGTW